MKHTPATACAICPARRRAESTLRDARRIADAIERITRGKTASDRPRRYDLHLHLPSSCRWTGSGCPNMRSLKSRIKQEEDRLEDAIWRFIAVLREAQSNGEAEQAAGQAHEVARLLQGHYPFACRFIRNAANV